MALPFNVEGQPPPRGEDPLADVRIVAPGYFETMKIRLLAGRFLDERDAQGAPRDERHQRDDGAALFPGPQPARADRAEPARQERGGGRRRRRQEPRARQRADEAGVSAARAKSQLPAWPSWRAPNAIRCSSGTRFRASSGASIRSSRFISSSTMDQILARAVFLPRLSTTLLAAFAMAAMLLAALGIYGVLSYSVTQRTREIGLRMALGSSGGRTLGLVVQDSVLLIAIGGVCGLAVCGLAGQLDGRHSLRHRSVRPPVVRSRGRGAGHRRPRARASCRRCARRASIRWSRSVISDHHPGQHLFETPQLLAPPSGGRSRRGSGDEGDENPTKDLPAITKPSP